MATKKKFDINKLIHWLLIIPTTLTAIGFMFSVFMIVPDHWREYKKMEKEHLQLIKKVYGASPDDMDGIRASVEKEYEIEKMREHARKLLPMADKFFSVELPKIKNDIKENKKYIDRLKKL